MIVLISLQVIRLGNFSLEYSRKFESVCLGSVLHEILKQELRSVDVHSILLMSRGCNEVVLACVNE